MGKEPGTLCPRCKDRLRTSKASYCNPCSAEYAREQVRGKHTRGRLCNSCGEHFNGAGENSLCSACQIAPHWTTCTKCSKDFLAGKGKTRQCVECRRANAAYMRAYQQGRREPVREKKYGLQPGEWERRLTEQENRCALCGVEFDGDDGRGRFGPCMDHDHRCCSWNPTWAHPVCGKCNRKILCKNCNSLIGLAGDSVQVLMVAAKYLRYAMEPKVV
jgi:hypothetical protein